jgi:hypothetical protein
MIADTTTTVQQMAQLIAAVGGLGTAAFGLVDASKAMPGGGVNRVGFTAIRKLAESLTPGTQTNALSQKNVVATLQANWFNGTDLSSQKAIAKSLIKMNLSTNNAGQVAQATGVDSNVLQAITASMATGTPLTAAQNDVYARFDLIVTAMLDETYQRSDNVYRNWTRAIAAMVAVILSVAAAVLLYQRFDWWNFGKAVLVGLLATPLAPIAKDLSTALATAVNTLQLVKK